MQLSLLIIQDFGLALRSLIDRILNYPYLFQKASNDFVIDQKGFLKITKKMLVSYLIVFMVFSGTGLFFLFNPFGTSTADAAWFNDNWSFRKRIDVTIATNASDRTNTDLYLTVDTTGITANLQTNCEDLRFTDVNGKILPYYTQSCNDNSATNKLFVRANLIPKDSTAFTMYMYYGNPSATAGSDSNTFSLYAGINGYWSFEESSAWATNCSTESVLDSSGNGTTFAPCPNASAATQNSSGKFGSAASFDGTNDRLDSLADDAVMDTTATDNLTLSAWVNFTNTTTDAGIIQKKGGASTGNPGWLFMHYSTGNGGNFCLYISDGSVQEETCTASYTTTATWVHVTAVYDRNSTDISGIYINGVRDISGTFTITAPSAVGDPTNTQAESIGSIATVASTYIAGKIDDVRMYKRALSPTEVTQLYNTNGDIAVTTSFASEEKGPAPTLYWEFDQGQGTTAEDATTNALDGTLNNTPTWQTENMCVASKCLYFDGTNNENVSIADNDKLDFAAADNFTVGAWIKRNGSASANTVILQKSTANIASTYTGYKLYMDASGDLCFDIQDGTNAVDTACTSAVDFDDNAWHFVEGVKAATTSVTLYVDGKQRAQDATIASTGTLANASTLYVGIDSEGISNDWLGFIDEVKIFRDNTARTASQVLADYNARSNPEGVSHQQGNNNQNMPTALSNGLVGYWKMDESSWTIDCATESVLDSSGNSNNGAACPNTTGPAGGAIGKYGNSGDFDGTNDYVDIDNTTSLQNTRYTHSFWMYADNASGTGSYEDVIGSNDAGQTSVNYAFQWSSANGASYQKTCMQKGEVGGYQLAQISSTMNAGTWYFVTCSYDGAYLKAYLNGKLEASVAGTNPNVANPIQIGADGIGSNNFNGKVDEFRIYNRALSGNEVSNLYNWAPGPSIYFKMDEKSGSTTYDSSGNGKNGALGASTAAPTWTNQSKYGGGLDFDGTDDLVSVATPNLPTTDFTYEAWVNRDIDIQTTFFASEQGADTNEFSFGIGNVGIVEIGLNGAAVASSTSTGVALGTWAHLAVTRSGSSVQIYINGVPDGSAGTDGTALSLTTCDYLYVGTDPTNCSAGVNTTFATYMNGKLDDARIYNYARSKGQIVEDMNAGHPTPGSPVGTPIGFWKFNEGADNMCSGNINDACNSGSGSTTYDGTSTATRTNSGKLSRALDFDGTDDVVTITNASGIDLNENLANFTFSSWIYADSDGEADTGQIFNKGANTYFRVDTQGTTDLDLECNLDLATTDANVNVTDGLTTAAWNHVACTWNGTTMSIYINGLLRGSSSSGSGAIAADANNLLIGGPTTANFDGKIDEFKVYNSALNAAQLALDANAASAQILGATGNNSTAGAVNAESQEYCIPGDSTTCTGPVGRWDFDSQNGGTHFDISGNGNTCDDWQGQLLVVGKIGKADNVVDSVGGTLGCGNGATVINLPDNGMTFEGWIYPRTEGDFGGGMIASKTAYNATGWELRFYGSGTNALKFHSDYATTDFDRVTADNAITLNAWNHVAFTWTGGAAYTTSHFYINGVEAAYNTGASSDGVGARVSDATEDLGFGDDDGGTGTFDGKFDQFRLFNYVRTPAQIVYGYNRGAPLAYWKIDECQGTTINDSSGNSYTGTLTVGGTLGTCQTASTSWGNGVTGKRNYSIDLNGSSDYIQVTDTSALRFDDATADFSLFAWVKRGTNGEMNVISKEDADNDGYRLQFTAGNVVRCSVDTIDIDSTRTITDTNWHLVGCTITRAGNGQVYIDGQANGTATAISSEVMASTSNIRLGTRSYTSANYLDGLLDDTRIYNYALTATQVKTLYNQGAANFAPTTGAP